MTIYGTPAGTPLNQTGGFQGTQPGNPVQVTLQPFIPAVGMFPPGATVANGGQLSGDTIQAAASRAAYPANTLILNDGTGANDSIMDGCPPLDGGNQASAANGTPFGSATGGGSAGIGGAGGADMNASVGAVGDVVLTNQANPSSLTYQGGGANPNQFMG
jgi:hypothetical protein